jgi:hypothetical protein
MIVEFLASSSYNIKQNRLWCTFSSMMMNEYFGHVLHFVI